MRNTLFGIILVLVSIFSNAQTNKLSLNGTWKFKAPIHFEWDNYYPIITTNLHALKWDSIAVPGNWDIENEYAGYVGDAAYYRKLEIPKSFREGELFIHFDAVYSL